MAVAIEKYKSLKFIQFENVSSWSSYALLGKNLIYTQKYSFVRIGDFLIRNKEQVLIQDDILYKRPTISINGRGIKLRDEVLGKEIGTKNQFRLYKDQFLLSKIDARNGAFGVVPNELDNGIITGNFWTFDVDYSKINPHYLQLLTGTKEFQKLCQTASVGTTNRNYLQEDLFLNFEIPLPTLAEQQQIVDAYTTKIQQAQALQTQANNLEEEIDKYLFEALGYKVKGNKNSNKVGTWLQIIEYKELDKWGADQNNTNKLTLTKPFEIKPISSLCTVSSGGTPSRDRKEYYINGNIPWIKTGEVINGIITDTEEKITKEAIENSSAKIYPKNSLIIAMYGQGLTRGRTAKLGIDASTNQACAVLFNIDNDIILTDFLWIYLIGEYHRLREMASGNNQPNLNAQMIKDYNVVVPPIAEQQSIISTVFAKRNAIKVTNENVNKLYEMAQQEFEKQIFHN